MQFEHVLTSSSTGYTVMWDFQNKHKVVALTYGGGIQVSNLKDGGGRKGMSDVAWHPDNVSNVNSCDLVHH